MELFVGTLGASSYTYVEATLNQSLESWAKAHKGMSDYFGGSTEIWVPDNLKSGVDLVDRYEPGINRTYEELATHYGAVVVPARVFKPKDKATVESAVQVAQRWILAVLRHRTFFSLAELNEAIWEKLEVLNARPMQKLGVSRRELYEKARPARTETATAGELRVIDVEAVQSEHRLPRGGGEQLVQRSLSAVMRLGSRWGSERLEAACARAEALSSYSYRTVKNILSAGLDRVVLESDAEAKPREEHENIRGADHYEGGESRC